MEKLKFQKGDAKLGKNIHTFSLPAGHSCPFAYECAAYADEETGKIEDGKFQRFRCFAASDEALRPTVRKARWHNYRALLAARTKVGMYNLIMYSFPKKATLVRVHVSGDFFNQDYFDAWMDVADYFKHIKFYAYTKSIPYWNKRKDSIPDNFELTASMGGASDNVVTLNNLKNVVVVFNPEEAESMGRELDHDDSHAYGQKESFALLLHGTQKAKSEASVALSKLKKKGFKGYSKK
jgi:hypothetical protein